MTDAAKNTAAGKKKILLIDDEQDFVEMVSGLLVSTGYEVACASNGVEGLEKLKEFTPTLIILDMNMPKMGGLEFYTKICTPDGRTKYPVLILTARANLAQLFKDLNVDGFMSKPFEIDHLLNELSVIIRKRSGGTVDTRPSKAVKLNKVFVIEDDRQVYEEISTTFLDAGFIVKSAKEGSAVLEGINDELPDIMLIKLILPDIPGHIVASKLKQMPKTMDIPIILYTAPNFDVHTSIIDMCKYMGINNVTKTSDPKELLIQAKSTLKK